MPLKIIFILIRALRFDDLSTRNERKPYDKLSPITWIFDEFIQRRQCIYCWKNCTIDAMLERFRRRCNFRKYIPNKPNRYDIKIQFLVDSRTLSTSNMECSFIDTIKTRR